MMWPADLNPWLVMLLAAISIGTSIWNFVSKPGAAAQAAVKELAGEVAKKADRTDVDRLIEKSEGVEERLAVVESEMKHLPDKTTTHAMELAFRDLQGKVDVLVERIGPIAKTSERLQEFLLSQGR